VVFGNLSGLGWGMVNAGALGGGTNVGAFVPAGAGIEVDKLGVLFS